MGVHKVPTVHLELAVQGGRRRGPAGKFGLASLTAAMLDEGAGSRTRSRSPTPSTSSAPTCPPRAPSTPSYVDLHVPVARLADALPIMADVALRPTFPDAELKRLRDERLTSLLQRGTIRSS